MAVGDFYAMNQSLIVYDYWKRDWLRLLVGLVFLGFGLGFWWVISHESSGSIGGEYIPLADAGRGIYFVYLLVAACCIAGILMIALRRLVFVDLLNRRLTRVIYCFYFPVHKRTWAFSDLHHVEVFHRSSGEEGYCCWIGLAPVSGSIIWLRTLNSPEAGPSDEVMTFADKLAETTGLKLNVRRKNPSI